MTTFTNISKRSPTSQNCHSHKSSPTTIWRFLFPLLLIRTWLSYIGPNVRCTSMLKVCLSNNKMKKNIETFYTFILENLKINSCLLEINRVRYNVLFNLLSESLYNSFPFYWPAWTPPFRLIGLSIGISFDSNWINERYSRLEVSKTSQMNINHSGKKGFNH